MLRDVPCIAALHDTPPFDPASCKTRGTSVYVEATALDLIASDDSGECSLVPLLKSRVKITCPLPLGKGAPGARNAGDRASFLTRAARASARNAAVSHTEVMQIVVYVNTTCFITFCTLIRHILQDTQHSHIHSAILCMLWYVRSARDTAADYRIVV